MGNGVLVAVVGRIEMVLVRMTVRVCALCAKIFFFRFLFPSFLFWVDTAGRTMSMNKAKNKEVSLLFLSRYMDTFVAHIPTPHAFAIYFAKVSIT